MGTQLRTALPSLATLGSSMASLLITTGALNSETGRYVTIALSLTAAAASAIPSIGALVGIFRSLAISIRATAVAQAVLLGLSGVGLPLIATGLAAGAAVAGGLVLLNRANNDNANRPGTQITVVNQGVGNMSIDDVDKVMNSIRERERLGG